MSNATDLSHLDVGYVADLARIALTDEEAARYGRELDAIVEYVRLLGELDVAGIEPTAHAMPRSNVTRPDATGECTDRARVLANAPATVDDNAFLVPVVIEEEGA